MLYLPPDLRLKIDADLAAGAPLYVLALERLSIVATLHQLAWQLAVTLGSEGMEEPEYAATLIEMLCPMAGAVHLLPPGDGWTSHATLRLHAENREDASETGHKIVMLELRVHDLKCSHEKLYGLPPRTRITLIQAYEEEAAIVRALDGFVGNGAELLERLGVEMGTGAILARAQLFYHTADRAQVGLHCLYTEDPSVRRRVERFATWLIRLQADDRRLERSLISPSIQIGYTGRRH